MTRTDESTPEAMGTDTTPPDAPTPQRPYGKPVPTHWSWAARLPLRVRLVVITAVLLATGLGIAALATVTVVSNYLVGQVDEQLERTAAEVKTATLNPGFGTTLPSEYYILVRDDSGAQQAFAWPQTIDRYGQPVIPEMSDPEVRAARDTPVTVRSTGGADRTQWRVTAFPVGDNTAFVALPLTEIHETGGILGRTLALTGLTIALLGGLVAYWAVWRAMRPLREIESTAAAIAGGDLARRVRPAPPSTEVGSLADSLNAMLAQIERAFAAREESEGRMRRFVSDASHELRTPLATIRGYGELYRMGALSSPEKIDDTMGRIEDAATRMGALVNDLLALARLDEGRPLRHEPVDLGALARDSAQDLHALDPSRSVRVIGLRPGEEQAPEGVVAIGDEDRLRQVLANLIGNVARHTPSGSPAELALGRAPDGGGAVIEVRDHGTGVSEEQAGRIFERFYRADSSRNRSSGGSGLGLAIVAAIVGAHHGTVQASPTPGGGLTVRVQLPEEGYDGGSSLPRSS